MIIILGIGCDSSKLHNFEAAGWPKKLITISCPEVAGKDEDALYRLIVKLMRKELTRRMNVINRPLGNGVQAMNYVAVRMRDGYNWCGFSDAMLMASVLGKTEMTAADWEYFMIADVPSLISVSVDSDYDDLESLIEAARINPKKVKVAVSSKGGIWHMKLLALQEAAGVEFEVFFDHEDGQNAFPKEADAMISSLSKQVKSIQKKQLRPLAMLEEKGFDFPEIGTISSVSKWYPSVSGLTFRRRLGFALVAETHPIIIKKIADAFQKVLASKEVKDFCQDRLLILNGQHGKKASQWAKDAEQIWVWKLHEMGLTTESPKAFGILKPESSSSSSSN